MRSELSTSRRNGHEKTYTPMLTRFDGGSAGFSTNSVTRPSGATSRMPNRCASSIGTVRTAHVTSAFRSRWSAMNGR